MAFNDILKNKNITQNELSFLLKSRKCFKYQQQISEWCRGVRVPDALTIYHLSKILAVSADELLQCFLESAGLI